MSKDFSFLNEDFDDLRDVLQQFENLSTGKSHSFLDEDSFEQIIDYYDERDQMPIALKAAEIAIEQLQEYPLCPFIVGRVTGLHFAAPVIAETNIV